MGCDCTIGTTSRTAENLYNALFCLHGSGNTPLANEAYPSALDPMMSVCCWRLTLSLVGRTSRLFRLCMRIQSNKV